MLSSLLLLLLLLLLLRRPRPACLAVMAVVLVPAAALAAAKASVVLSKPQGAPQRKCFCVRPTGKPFQPYEVVKSNTDPACAKTVYNARGKPAWENVIGCNDMNQCLTRLGEAEREKARLEKRIQEIKAGSNARAMATLPSWEESLAAEKKKIASLEYACWEKPLKT